MLQFPPAKTIQLPQHGARDAIALSVHEQGSGFPVVLLHGFPELAFSWRYQIPALAQAGFRAIAPDQRGFGSSDIPANIEDYDIVHLAGDIAALLDALGIDRAVFLGHDWGGAVAWAMPLLHPDRTAGVISLCTPYRAFPRMSSLRETWGDDKRHYFLWFQAPGVAEGFLDQRTRLVFEKFMRRNLSPAEIMKRTMEAGIVPDMNPFRRVQEMPLWGEPLLTDEELAFYVSTYERTGFRGGINWYRNMDRNSGLLPGRGKQRITVPSLMVTAEWDFVLPPSLAEPMRDVCDDLEIQMVPRAGHWVQQEFPDEVNRLAIDWLRRRLP
jgi:pimeloyl-ACP methyl ester carboxylesterase